MMLACAPNSQTTMSTLKENTTATMLARRTYYKKDMPKSLSDYGPTLVSTLLKLVKYSLLFGNLLSPGDLLV